MVKTKTKNTPTPSSTSIMNHSSSKSEFKKKYKGVRMRSWGSWVSEIRAPNQKARIWLGSYSTQEAAARAYDAALLCLKGSSANFNFPISKNLPPIDPRNSGDSIMSRKSIQRAAAAAAAAASVDFVRIESSAPHSSNCSISSGEKPDEHECKVQFEETSISAMASWYNFDSTRYDEMMDGAFFDPDFTFEDNYEDDDIRLWSFY